jgi:hypothetical protein
MEAAKKMHNQFEDWYDAHPKASFGEIEGEARKQRRELMGKELASLVNGRDTGFQMEAPRCKKCGGGMGFEGYHAWQVHGLEGDSLLERAYYVCPDCKGEAIFPLDAKLQLRADHWSEGAARVAARQGLQAKSFDLAAEAYSDATGSSMSGDSLRRVTEGFGERLEQKRKVEAEKVYDAKAPQMAEQVVTITAPIHDQANISTDGGMVLLREEGWKEVKMSVISEVAVSATAPTLEDLHPDPKIMLKYHSYQVGLWNADEIQSHQYLEGTRRQVALCVRLGSVNDGAIWIDRITATNYPQATQVIDWGHATERLWKVARAAFGEGTQQTQHWVEKQLDCLWDGRVAEVVTALFALNWKRITCLDDIRESPAYFKTRQSKMDYARFRQAGYPIGSGTVESGVNTVVHHRMKRQGRGWKRQNAQAMFAALGELHSGRFQSAWQAELLF